jgi:hypothetical protein
MPNGAFSRNSWAVPVLYGLVLLFALFPGLARVVALTHMLAWEFMTN